MGAPRFLFNPMHRLLLISCALLAASSLADSQIRFVDESASAGLLPAYSAPGLTVGLAAADYDDDGDVDLFVPNGQGAPNQLYRNEGAGQFIEVAAQVGLSSTRNARSALWFDSDGDRDLDLVVLGDCYEAVACDGVDSVEFYLQDPPGQFQLATTSAGLGGLYLPNEESHVGGACAGDVNGDGWLDLYFGYWEGASYLFLNDGQGGFVDASVSSGVSLQRPFWQPVMHDFNGDGALDIFQAVDYTNNILWLNDGVGGFSDVAAAAGTDNAMNDMGVAIGDWNNDGDQDVYVTNQYGPGEHNIFLVRRGQGEAHPNRRLEFDEGAKRLDIEQGHIGWGATFLDADLDGWLDLAETSSSLNPIEFFHNRGGHAGFDQLPISAGLGAISSGGGLISLDYDRDGDLDLLEAGFNAGPPRLYSNDRVSGAGGRQALTIKPRAVGRNHRAIGALVECRFGGQIQTRVVTAGTSMMSQEPAEVTFGLPTGAQAEIRIRWPDGVRSVHSATAGSSATTLWKP